MSHSVVNFGFRWLVHQSGTDSIEWCNHNSTENTSCHSSKQLHLQTFFNTISSSNWFEVIIAWHLWTCHCSCSPNVGRNAFVETSKSLILVNVFDEIVNPWVLFAFVCHHSYFKNIKWISTKWSNGTWQTSSCEFDNNAWVFWSNQVSNWSVKTKSKSWITCFSKPRWLNSLIESSNTLFSPNSSNDTSNTLILFCFSANFACNL